MAIELLLLPPAAHGQLWTVQLEMPPGNCRMLVETGRSVGAATAERAFAMTAAVKPHCVNPPAATDCISALRPKRCSLSYLARTGLLGAFLQFAENRFILSDLWL